MAKADLGTKRICRSCGMRFYDFNRIPILCPGCQAEFDSHTKTKVRKTRVRDKFTEEKDQKSVEENDLDSQIEELDEIEDIKLEPEDEIDFDENETVLDDDDSPGIIQDDLGENDELLPDLDGKDE